MPIFEGTVPALDGEANARVRGENGQEILVRNVLPGEHVRVTATERRGRSLRAQGRTLVTTSDARIEPPCPLADACGGCALMHASASFVADFKRERVVRAVLPAAPAVEITIDVPEAQLGYRTRARLAFERGSMGIVLGYRQAWGTRVVDVARCPVLAPVLEAALETLRVRWMPSLEGRGELRLGVHDAAATVYVESDDAQPAAVYTGLDALVAEGVLAGAALRAGGATVPATFGVKTETSADVDGRRLELPLGGFSQAHAAHNRVLGALVVADARPSDRVLELFAGHGNFSLPLASRTTSLTAVELASDAVRCLRENLVRHGLSASAIASDAAAAMRAVPSKSVDLLVLDPPREGAHEVMRTLRTLAPSRVVYVSCDSVSLGRDLAIASESYEVRSVRALDMFPQTPHVETVATLERRAR